jgi:cardiolipin synthase A/B
MAVNGEFGPKRCKFRRRPYFVRVGAVRRGVLVWGLTGVLLGLPACERTRPSRATLDPGETLFTALTEHTGARARAGNSLTLLENGTVFDAIVDDVRAARSSIHVVTYIWRGDGQPSRRVGQAILQALAERPGLQCRILIDPFGSLKFDDGLRRRLEQAGCDVRKYDRAPLPDPLARNHRKIVVVDGQRAITGGFGIHSSWLGYGRAPDEWRDTAVRVRGPVVADMQRAFEQSWREVGGAPLPAAAYPPLEPAGGIPGMFIATSPSPGRPSAAEAMYRLLVQAAKRRLWIANSYFIPGPDLQRLMIERRRAGVDVRVMGPGPVHDVPPVRAAQRATYRTLLAGGVRIFEYEASMMHAKTVVVDDRYVLVGSTNMDGLSFAHLEEGSLVAIDPALARTMARHFEQDLKYTKEITREIWDNRDVLPEVGRRGVELVSDWL